MSYLLFFLSKKFRIMAGITLVCWKGMLLTNINIDVENTACMKCPVMNVDRSHEYHYNESENRNTDRLILKMNKWLLTLGNENFDFDLFFFVRVKFTCYTLVHSDFICYHVPNFVLPACFIHFLWKKILISKWLLCFPTTLTQQILSRLIICLFCLRN